MMKLSGINFPLDTLFLALLADIGKLNVWIQTKDALTGKNRPQSIFETLVDIKKDKPAVFESPEAFMEWREKMMGG